jgi:cytolysin-activating lysine-acyltransferase
MNNSEALGRMVWLMGHSRHHASYKVSDIYRLILPAIANYQYRVWDGENNPQGFMIWAWLTDEASENYERGSVHITGQDFVGGNNLWIVELVMPFGNAKQMMFEARKHLISLYGKGTILHGRRTKNNLFKKVIL